MGRKGFSISIRMVLVFVVAVVVLLVAAAIFGLGVEDLTVFGEENANLTVRFLDGGA